MSGTGRRAPRVRPSGQPAWPSSGTALDAHGLGNEGALGLLDKMLDKKKQVVLDLFPSLFPSLSLSLLLLSLFLSPVLSLFLSPVLSLLLGLLENTKVWLALKIYLQSEFSELSAIGGSSCACPCPGDCLCGCLRFVWYLHKSLRAGESKLQSGPFLFKPSARRYASQSPFMCLRQNARLQTMPPMKTACSMLPQRLLRKIPPNRSVSRSDV